MSVRRNLGEGARITGGVIFGIALMVIVVLAMVATWAGVAPWVTSKQREINHSSQQYQDAQITEAESLLEGILRAGDTDQQEILTARYCTTYDRIIDPPNDLVVGASKYC